ncbi:hypothetical protein niasHT_023816 [Heterodera trifolii]|uniref:Glycoside hydrolase family 5 domain-containing protein n=1 Tax=Heterodera trifolii TaxID=157864 RepID=A0ABD2JS96_9BILA
MSAWICPGFLLFFVLILITDRCPMTQAVTQPPYGQLAVSGKNLVQKSTKKAVALHGLSMYWSQWVPKFWVKQTVNKLKCSCNANVVRAAMASSLGGYIANPTAEYKKMTAIIDGAIDQGIYVVVDWHTGDDLATTEIKYATDFFTKIAKAYNKYPHILYEIWNEPNKFVTWEAVVKPYAKTMIDVIRKYDKNNVIIVGTPNWDQDVDIVAKSPLKDANIIYTMHFYAGQHKDDIRNKVKTAYKLGLPMFVTEYGCYSADGNEQANLEELKKWMQLLDGYGISYAAWHVADIGEQSSILTKTSEVNNICDPAHLTNYGKAIINKLKSQNNGVKCSG